MPAAGADAYSADEKRRRERQTHTLPESHALAPRAFDLSTISTESQNRQVAS
jgi:hypothetical protein